MTAPVKLAGFPAILAVLFAGGALAGGLIDPDAPGPKAEAQSAGRRAAEAHGMDGMAGDTHAAADGERTSAHGPMSMGVRGLAVAENGLRIVVEDPELRRGRTEMLRFRIVDDQGRAVRDFDVEHTKRMHVIVARRDLATFQHLHPVMAADGTWSTPLRLRRAGSYRVFADFSHDGRATTLASDLRVDGAADLVPLPAPASTAKSAGGYAVRLGGGAPRAGQESALRFTITKDGRPVRVEPYLGADGHLVALREGDLAFLHVHPTEQGHGTGAGRDDSIGFEATFPTSGRYRLFLQFKHEGRVRTVAFTSEVE
ncbi:MAG: hypothetical protein IRZ21_06735 [Thermoleophilaceae bacterium]|nr:hypothetical protein [Thermoleophilaceae bacterium]